MINGPSKPLQALGHPGPTPPRPCIRQCERFGRHAALVDLRNSAGRRPLAPAAGRLSRARAYCAEIRLHRPAHGSPNRRLAQFALAPAHVLRRNPPPRCAVASSHHFAEPLRLGIHLPDHRPEFARFGTPTAVDRAGRPEPRQPLGRSRTRAAPAVHPASTVRHRWLATEAARTGPRSATGASSRRYQSRLPRRRRCRFGVLCPI
jgi:hypothetical protein